MVQGQDYDKIRDSINVKTGIWAKDIEDCPVPAQSQHVVLAAAGS